MRKGSIDAADSVTARIAERIITHNKTAFHNFPSGSREMWSLVRTITGKEQRKQQFSKDLTVDDLNQHLSAISTDPHYEIPPLKHTVNHDLEEFTEWHVFHILETVKSTAMGLDGLPEWFIRIAAAAFARPITHLFNLSLNFSVVPSQWKSSRISPIPKTAQPLPR